MESIKDKVAIVGMGCTKFGEIWDKSVDDLIIEAAHEACKDAGIEPKDIQAAWLGTANSGFTALSLSVPLKLQYIPVTRVENLCVTGSEALRAAAYAVAAGVYDVVLALGVEKMKDVQVPWVGNVGESGIATSGVFGANYPIVAPPFFARIATRYAYHYGLGIDELRKYMAQVAVKNHHNGALAPKAQFQREITLEQAMNAPIVAWPFGLFDCCGVTDGAAAAIITRADMAKSFRDDPVNIKALEVCVGANQGFLTTDYDWVHFEENVLASKKAYAQAGIKDPRKELSIAEVHDCFTVTEMVIYEDFGFCPRGEAKDYVESGAFSLEGELPVNTDGGLKCFGHPFGASGLRMMYDVNVFIVGH
jgi:acetyl-CoA C-acetyltransferase